MSFCKTSKNPLNSLAPLSSSEILVGSYPSYIFPEAKYFEQKSLAFFAPNFYNSVLFLSPNNLLSI